MLGGGSFEVFVGEFILWCYCLLLIIEAPLIFTWFITSLFSPLCFNPFLELCIFMLLSKCFKKL